MTGLTGLFVSTSMMFLNVAPRGFTGFIMGFITPPSGLGGVTGRGLGATGGLTGGVMTFAS